MWLSWSSGCFQFKRSVVRIQSLAKIYIEHLLSTVLKRRKYRKEAGNGPFFKKSNPISQRATTEFFLNSDNFQNSPNVAVGFGYFCKKICHLNLPKIAQSCHTGRLNTLDNTLRRRRFSHFFSCLLTKSWSVLNFQ